jgi:hemerythrin superfamily protein
MTDATNPMDLGRPTEGDVVDLILDDHRRFEALLRELRDVGSDRDAVRRAFSALHVAHAEAEEEKVYPTLRRKDAISEHEEEHGEHEHAEGHEALLKVLEAEELEGEDFDELVEKLATAVNHHLSEEELTILNPAREDVSEDVRQRLGVDFATERNKQLDADCGRVENVRRLVEEADKKGLLEE